MLRADDHLAGLLAAGRDLDIAVVGLHVEIAGNILKVNVLRSRDHAAGAS